ncbi:MAG: ATPase P [Desulfobacterales bacterium]|jgi:P-type E1-E2 ATPase|nr:ATPase P [Desulfobacterales bacterium]
MIEISIPGRRSLNLQYLVLDYNGTIAHNGEIIAGVKQCLIELAEKLEVHVVTADTFGNAVTRLAKVPCNLHLLDNPDQDRQKMEYVKSLGSDITVCIGNGRNDCLMLKEACLGIAVILGEGACSRVLFDADIVCTSIITALELLIFPKRPQATLRN